MNRFYEWVADRTWLTVSPMVFATGCFVGTAVMWPGEHGSFMGSFVLLSAGFGSAVLSGLIAVLQHCIQDLMPSGPADGQLRIVSETPEERISVSAAAREAREFRVGAWVHRTLFTVGGALMASVGAALVAPFADPGVAAVTLGGAGFGIAAIGGLAFTARRVLLADAEARSAADLSVAA